MTLHCQISSPQVHFGLSWYYIPLNHQSELCLQDVGSDILKYNCGIDVRTDHFTIFVDADSSTINSDNISNNELLRRKTSIKIQQRKLFHLLSLNPEIRTKNCCGLVEVPIIKQPFPSVAQVFVFGRQSTESIEWVRKIYVSISSLDSEKS